jgi:hypothetical protein
MFGGKTSDEITKRYAKKQFFLPKARYRLVIWLTNGSAHQPAHHRGQNSIRGISYALAPYERDDSTFQAAFQTDKLMGVKILHFLDRVFQEFPPLT